MIKIIMKYVFVFLCLISALMIPQVSADTVAPGESFVYYNFYLYYDHGQLFADRDYPLKYDIIDDKFVEERITTAKPYSFKVLSIKDVILAEHAFDPQQGNPKFLKGKVLVKGPYFADAARVDFYDDTGGSALTIDVSASSFCNDDGACNKDVGEDSFNCPADCKADPTATPPPIEGGGLSRGVLTALGGSVVAIVIWLGWLIIKKRRAGAQPSPQIS